MLFTGAAQQASAQVSGEYFWNDDPGVGKATPTGAAKTDGEYSTFDIAADKIPAGMNILGLRAFTGGRWTHTVTYFVTVAAQPTAADWRVEYFWDNDPGVGKATPLETTLGQDGGVVIADIPADGLSAGEHLVGFRTCSGRAWSQTVTYTVMVPAKPGSADWRAEYFWDKDPGVGKATPLATALGQDGGEIDADLSTDGLEPGEHLLGVRTSSGHGWSQTVTSTVVVSDPRQYTITGAEYFWGKDPGFGKGTPIGLTPGEEVSIEGLEIEFPAEKADEYVLSFRARSEKGWGLTQTTVIPHLYVEKIELSADNDWLEPDGTLTVNAQLTPADAFEAGLEWASSNPEVATVAADGTVTGVAPGSVTVTARATDGSEATASIDLTVMIAVRELTVSPRELSLEMTREAALAVTVTPADATNTDVVWSIAEGEEFVSLGENGTVTGLKPGVAKIAVTAADGCGASDTCVVTVTYLRGDANGNGSLAVNDVVLTARGVVNDIDPTLIFEAVDMNADNSLTVGDLTQVVDAVISYAAPADMSARNRSRAMDDADMAAPLLLTQSGRDISVAFDNEPRFTGVQFDVVAEDGLTVASVTLDRNAKRSHSAANRRMESGAMRMLAYGTEAFAANEAIATIHTESEDMTPRRLTLTNIMASDLRGNLYSLPDSKVTVNGTTGIGGTGDGALNIKVEGHTVIITADEDTQVIITDMRGIMTRLEVSAGVTRHTVPVDGVYVVNNQKIIIR